MTQNVTPTRTTKVRMSDSTWRRDTQATAVVSTTRQVTRATAITSCGLRVPATAPAALHPAHVAQTLIFFAARTSAAAAMRVAWLIAFELTALTIALEMFTASARSADVEPDEL